MAQEHPPGPPMTLGNMGQLGSPMFGQANRRAFIAAFGDLAAYGARARQPSMPLVAIPYAVKSLHSCSDHCGDADAKSGSTYYRFGHDW
jgi:hypothetical protein